LARPQARYASSSTGGGGAGFKLALFGGVTVVSVAGGTLGYAGIDPEFRTYVEENVPGAKDVFGTILGPPEPAKPLAAPPSKLKIPKDLPGLPVTSKPPAIPAPPMPPLDKPKAAVKKVEPEVVKVEAPKKEPEVVQPEKVEPLAEPVFDAKVEKKPEIAAPKVETVEKASPEPEIAAPKVEPVEEASPEPEIVEPPKEAEVEPPKEAEVEPPVEKAADAEPRSLEVLTKAVEDMKVAVGMAAISGQQCVEAIGKHGQLVVGVLEQNVDDTNNDTAWHDVIGAANDKSEAVKAAQDKLSAAKDQLEKVGLALKDVQGHADAEAAGKEVEAAHNKILEISEQMHAAKKDSYLIEQYRDLVEDGRQQFRRELAALLPGEGVDGQLTEEEMNVFVTHAYKRVSSLQQQLAKVKLLQQQIDASSLSDQQLRKQVVTEEVVQEELEAQKRQLEVEHQHRLTSIREEMEGEMRAQLRRQAAAHHDHIKDSLDVQQTEINRKFQRKLDEALSEERSKYKTELAKLAGSVEGLKVAVRERAGMQTAVRNAQELWLACTSLQRALEASRPESGVLPLEQEVAAIKRAAETLVDPFVTSVVASLPAEALQRGVYTDQTIRDRFFKVELMAKRTALIDENGGSLLMYCLSYLQSMLVISPSTASMPDPEVDIEPESLNTFDIVWLARGCVERGDLEQAVRYMTLLRGQPKKVASEWIREARMLLETRQVCDALVSHAAAHGLEAFPDKA